MYIFPTIFSKNKNRKKGFSLLYIRARLLLLPRFVIFSRLLQSIFFDNEKKMKPLLLAHQCVCSKTKKIIFIVDVKNDVSCKNNLQVDRTDPNILKLLD